MYACLPSKQRWWSGEESALIHTSNETLDSFNRLGRVEEKRGEREVRGEGRRCFRGDEV